MRLQHSLALALAVSGWSASLAGAADFTNQVFEAGSLVGVDNSTQNVASTSTPDQWHLWSVSGTNRAMIGATGRTFQTGTTGNDQALFVKLATPGMTQGDLEGAMFRSNAPYKVLPGQVVYTVMETFTDLGSVSASQLLKVDVRFGSAGNTADYGGFSNSLSEWSVNSNANTLLTGQNQGIAVVGGGATSASHFPHIKYDGALAESSELNARTAFDRSYVMSAVYRPISGGTNAEMTSTDGVNPARYDEGRTQAGVVNPIDNTTSYATNTINTMHTEIDRVVIHFRRNLGTYNGINKSEFNNYGPIGAFPEGATNTASAGYASSVLRAEGTGEILNPADMKMGIKSLRIGATWVQDINLDGVVNAADKTVVQTNQGLTAATLLQGDVTNDGLVDAADLGFFATLLGDYDGDGSVNGNDMLVWQAQLGATVAAGTGADGNRSGVVDATDLDVWKSQFGQVASLVAAVGAVPEPTTGIMLLVGGALATAAARRQNRRRHDIV